MHVEEIETPKINYVERNVDFMQYWHTLREALLSQQAKKQEARLAHA